jgi:hypothetical protein
MDTESANQWEIDQDDFGNPLVRHRHPTITVGAYVSKDAVGGRTARCPDCGEQFAVPGRPREAR